MVFEQSERAQGPIYILNINKINLSPVLLWCIRSVLIIDISVGCLWQPTVSYYGKFD